MVKPLSKRAQLLSPSILMQAMFSGPLYQVSRLGFMKETFLDIFRPWEPHLGMPVEKLLVSKGIGFPSLLSPLSHVNSLQAVLLRSLGTIFHEMVRTTTSETISIFPLTQLDGIGKTDNIPNPLICFSSST